MNRELFFVLYNGAAWSALAFQTDTGMTLREAVSANAVSYNKVGQDKGDPQFATDPEAYDLFSWHLQSLPLAARVAQVPRPGVVLAVYQETPDAAGKGTIAVAIMLRRELEGDEKAAERFSRYLNGAAPRWPAVPLAERDLFVSHDAEDAAVVADLVKHVEAAQLTCLAMERPGVTTSTEGEAWRRALASSAVLVSIVGPSSVEHAAVLREAGAAWALGRPIVPALVGVPPERLHYLMSRYQVRKIKTPRDRATLATELAEFMDGTAGGMTDWGS